VTPPLASVARWLRLSLCLLGAGAVAVLVWQAGPRAVGAAIRDLGWRLPVVILIPYALSATLHTLGWTLTFPERRPPFAQLWRARLIGEAVNVSTPTASVGGEPVKAYLLRPWIPLAEGFASVVLDKTTVVVGQGLFLLGGLALALAVLPAASPLTTAMAALLAVESLAVAGFVLVQLQGVAGRGGRLLSRIGMGPTADRQAKLEGLDQAIADMYWRRPGQLALSSLWHLAAWAVGGLELYLILTFLGLPVSFTAALVMEAFGAAIRFASFMIPASLGALEGGNMAIFAAFGLPASAGLLSTLIRRLREVAWALAGLAVLAAQRARPEPVGGETLR
jgi:putative membrane protein